MRWNDGFDEVRKRWAVFKMMDLSIIIVSYNTKDLLRDCLHSLFEHVPQNLQTEIFVVDNASSDGSAQAVKKEFPQVRLITNSENFGFAKANNQALRQTQGKYCLFLNPDTVILPYTIPVMLDFMEVKKDVAVATCRIELPNGLLDLACRRGFPTPWAAFTHHLGLPKIFPQVALFNHYNLLHLPQDQTYEIDVTCGAFFLTRKKAIDEVGFWSEDFFMYGEDIDWCYRFKSAGWKVMYYPKTKIIHYKGASSGLKKSSREVTRATKSSKGRAIHAFYNAMRIFYDKHYKEKYPQWLTKLVFWGIGIKKSWELLKNRFSG